LNQNSEYLLYSNAGRPRAYANDNIGGGQSTNSPNVFTQPSKIITTTRNGLKSQGVTTTIYENGLSAAVGGTEAFPGQDDGTRIGSRHVTGVGEVDYFDGNLAELIVYSGGGSLKSLNEKQKIESYLALKYGITLDSSV